MLASFWHWLVISDAGLLARIAAGACVFAALAYWDVRRKGRHAQRWREYLFLLAAVAAALAYGVINDQITVGVCPEYFLYGKELSKALGPIEPRATPALRWEAAKVGMKATWTAGLIFGVAILLANNPRRRTPQLRYRQLYALIPLVLVSAAACGALGGLGGWLRLFAGLFEEIVQADLWRPRRFMAVWGIHLGGYVGGLIGAFVAVVSVVRKRGRLRSASARRE